MTVDYELLYRLVTRCSSIGVAVETPQSVKLVYTEIVAAPVAAYVAAYEAVGPKTTARTQAHAAVERTLEALEQPYKEARALAAVFVTGVVLPDTLKSASTDTDKANAVRGMLRLLADHHGEKWVDAVEAGAFPSSAPPALQALGAAVAADDAVLKAETARAKAFDPAYRALLSMRNIVREGMGRNSQAYRRLRIPRSRAAKAAEVAAEKTAAAPATPAAAPPKPSSPDGTGATTAPSTSDKPAEPAPSAPK
jgi:hypothetical protein